MQLNIGILIASLLFYLATAFVLFTMHSRLLSFSNRYLAAGVFLISSCSGTGIWAAHFLATLSLFGNRATGYHPAFLAISLLIAVGAMAAGISVSLDDQRSRSLIGGAIIGTGSAAAELSVLLALKVSGDWQWNIWALLAGILISIAAAAGAIFLYRKQSEESAVIVSTAAFVAAGLFLQFGTMAGLTISANPQPAIFLPLQGMTPALLAGGPCALVLLIGYLAAHLHHKNKDNFADQQRELLSALTEGVILAKDGTIVAANRRAAELCGCNLRRLAGRNVFEEVLTGSVRETNRAILHHFECTVARSVEETIPVRVVHQPLQTIKGVNEVFAILDVSEWTQKTQQLTEENEALQERNQELDIRNRILDRLVLNIQQGLAIFDSERNLMCFNEAYTKIYRLPPDAIQVGMPLEKVIQKRIDKGIYAGRSAKAYLESRINMGSKEDSVHELNNGQIIHVRRHPLPHGYWLTIHEDITEQRRLEARVAHLEAVDSLTELPCHNSLRIQLESTLDAASRHRRPTAILMLSIDRFSEINDTMGHTFGDSLLRLVAKRLRHTLRRSTILGRFGDDTFLVIEATEHPSREAAALADRLLEEMQKPYMIGNVTIEAPITIGIALAPADGRNADTILQHVDLALNKAKTENRGTYCFFEPAMDRDLKHRRALERDLREALAKDELQVHYQPLVNFIERKITGFEALLRWRHPSRGDVSPAVFVQLAEEAQLLPKIGKWLLHRACAEAVGWPEHLSLAVNVSVSQFRSPDFIRLVMAAVTKTGLAPHRLELEVTEKVMEDDPEETIRKLKELSEFGVHITLDDFGSGFASLHYLRKLSFNKIKIARGFIGDLTEREESKVIVRTLLRMGGGFGVSTVAVGIENKEQLEFVRAEGCAEMQGYYFSPPKTSSEIHQLFSSPIIEAEITGEAQPVRASS